MRANLPKSEFFLGKTVPGRPDIEIRALVDSGNDGRVYRGFSTTLQRNVACKVIPRANLQLAPDGAQQWEREVHKADALRNEAVVRFEDIKDWKDAEAGIDCVVLISEFVDGCCLRKFVEDNRGDISVPFVVHWLKSMLDVFFEMERKNIKHGDLHAGNILVEDRSSYALALPRYTFRVTDFGVADASSERRFKDDYHQLADVLALLLRSVDYSQCSAKDKYMYDVLRNEFLSRHLIEDDRTRDSIARRPQELFQHLQTLEGQFEPNVTDPRRLLKTPFDFLSCEQIGEAPALLKALYSDRFLGLAEIESRNNVVVTGPRGCGKTTVFRSLSLDQRIQVGDAAPRATQYLGVYYRCDDLYFSFPRYRSPDRSDAIDIPLHFVTATLLSKLFESFQSWARQQFADDYAAAEARVSAELWKQLQIKKPQLPGIDNLQSLASALNKERSKAAEWHRFANDRKRQIGHCFGPEVLSTVTGVLTNAFPFARQLPVYFFIDDYSSPKISKELQANLNRLFFQRSAICFFKLSTESPVSFVKNDLDGKNYVENREFVLYNLGLVYLHAEVKAKLAFIEDVFRRRLQNTDDFPVGTLLELIGSRQQNNNELARSIREGDKPQLWGQETLCSLCSGDIHYVISLVGDMVRLAGGPESIDNQDPIKISPPLQNNAIRSAAGSFLRNLRSIPKCGDRLVDIVEAFGNVANSHLKFSNSKNNDSNPPKQATRIEPFEPLDLSLEARQLYEELLRYSVFIEDYRGKSRRGHVVPRLFLRRFLIPHFNLTFSTRDSIELEPDDFEAFLTRPKDFEMNHRMQRADFNGGPTLFDDGQEVQ